VGRSGAYNRLFTPFGFQGEERTLWEAPEVPARAACAPTPPSRPRLAWSCMNLNHQTQSHPSSGVPRHVSVSGRRQDRGAFPTDTRLRGAFATPPPPEPASRPCCTARALEEVGGSLAGLPPCAAPPPEIGDPISLSPQDNNPGTFPMQSERLFQAHPCQPRAAPPPLPPRHSSAPDEGYVAQALKGHGRETRLVLLPLESHGYQAKESVPPCPPPPPRLWRKGAPLSMLLRVRCFTCSLKCSRGCARTYRPR